MHVDDYRGETSRSYLTGRALRPDKFAKEVWTPVSPKEGERLRAEIAWVGQHRYRIGGLVGVQWDYTTLQTIAKLVGYDENAK